ncbi:MAG: hypothetical protein Q8P78_02155, partial [bacterium]|nr:hypothetical protein [bacterium]
MAIDIVKNTRKKVETSKKKLAKTIELKSYRKLAVNFLILTVNLIIIILYFSLSQAKVQIVPAKEMVSHSVEITIAENPDASSGLAIAGAVQTTQAEHTQEFAVASGGTEDSLAQGVLTITNTTSDRDQIFVANTRFANEAGILLKTRQQVTVPRGQSLAVAAYADAPGAAGEVKSDAGRFQVVALPYLKDSIYAEVSEPFTGGTKPVQMLTQEAYDAARAEMEKALAAKGVAVLSESAASDIDKEKLAVSITELTATAKPGDRDIQTFIMEALGTVSALAYDETLAREIIKQELVKQIPPDKMLLQF